jgi:flavin-dependent dehydrogenase
MRCDVAIVGGGPAGSTLACLLKKYDPLLQVSVFERERFPRDHVGESQLPGVSAILDEMGVWDKVEAANFPIKLGSTNLWGKNPELWDFEFIPAEQFKDEARPAKYEGQRRATAFQVDRAIYDKILLDHARTLGADVQEETAVSRVNVDGDRILTLDLTNHESVTADVFVDASGHTGILRRALGVKCTCPSTLQNIAFWDYWTNAEWAETIGIGGTKVQVMSLGYGWLWFIPLGPDRTSIGLVLPVDHYKKSKEKPLDLYLRAISEQERIGGLTRNASREGKFQTTTDWSFLAERHAGKNWFLVGESGGFADPILAAGMTITQSAAREAAYTILESRRGERDSDWLKNQYEIRQTKRITSHIRFADFWYTSNAQFSDLKDFTQQIATDAGLDLSPDEAWRWLATGGFIDENLQLGTGGFTLFAIRSLGSFLSDLPEESPLDGMNVVALNLEGAGRNDYAEYRSGRVMAGTSYSRDGKVLPVSGVCETVIDLVKRNSDISDFFSSARCDLEKRYSRDSDRSQGFKQIVQALEAMVTDGWVRASFDSARPKFKVRFHAENIKTKSHASG